VSKCSNPQCHDGYITFINNEDGTEDIEDKCSHCNGTGIKPVELISAIDTANELRERLKNFRYESSITGQPKGLQEHHIEALVESLWTFMLLKFEAVQRNQRQVDARICRKKAEKYKKDNFGHWMQISGDNNVIYCYLKEAAKAIEEGGSNETTDTTPTTDNSNSRG